LAKFPRNWSGDVAAGALVEPDRFSWQAVVSFFLSSRESGEKKIVAIRRAPALTVRRRLEHALLSAQIQLQRMLHDGGKRSAQLEERLKETPPVEIVVENAFAGVSHLLGKVLGVL